MTAQNPYASIGLPPTWAPSPAVVAVAKVEQRGPAGDATWHVLRFDTTYGVVGYALDNDAARTVIDALTAQVSGIAVARSIPAGRNGNGRT